MAEAPEEDIETLLARSSFGDREARRAYRSVSAELARSAYRSGATGRFTTGRGARTSSTKKDLRGR